MGIAISPRGDMPKHRVLSFERDAACQQPAPEKPDLFREVGFRIRPSQTLSPDFRRVLSWRDPCGRSVTATSPFCCHSISRASATMLLMLGHFDRDTAGFGPADACHRVGRLPDSPRRALLAAGLLMAGTGVGFAGVEGFWPLLVIAFVGTLNPSGGDVSLFLPLEHTVIAHVVADEERTAAFARYSFVGAFFGALGAFSVGTVDWLAPVIAPSTMVSGPVRTLWCHRAAHVLLYRHLSHKAEAGTDSPPAPLGPSRGIVYRLAALFSVDAFGGGLVINAFLALWLSQRFGISVSTIGAIFFVTSLCSAVLFRGGAAGSTVRLDQHDGVHAPTVQCLADPDRLRAHDLDRVRAADPAELLSQMDVPTRSSYVMAVVRPEERPAAASVTAVPRSLASALAPLLSGWLLTVSPFGWPLVLAGTLKVAYDLTLLRQFSAIKPPEER